MIRFVTRAKREFVCGLNKIVVSPLVEKKPIYETKITQCGLMRSVIKNGKLEIRKC